MLREEFEASMDRIVVHYGWIVADKTSYLNSIYEHVKNVEAKYFDSACIALAARLNPKRAPLPADFLLYAREHAPDPPQGQASRGMTKQERAQWNLHEAEAMGPKGATLSLDLSRRYGVKFDPEIQKILEAKAVTLKESDRPSEEEYFV